jgi:hypothetical protein
MESMAVDTLKQRLVSNGHTLDEAEKIATEIASILDLDSGKPLFKEDYGYTAEELSLLNSEDFTISEKELSELFLKYTGCTEDQAKYVSSRLMTHPEILKSVVDNINNYKISLAGATGTIFVNFIPYIRENDHYAVYVLIGYGKLGEYGKPHWYTIYQDGRIKYSNDKDMSAINRR